MVLDQWIPAIFLLLLCFLPGLYCPVFVEFAPSNGGISEIGLSFQNLVLESPFLSCFNEALTSNAREIQNSA